MAIINDSLRVVFLDEPLVPMPKFRAYFASLPGAKVVGRPGEAYRVLRAQGYFSRHIIDYYRFFTVICNPAIAILRWKSLSMEWWDQPMDKALAAVWKEHRLFPQIQTCEYWLTRERFQAGLNALCSILNVPKTDVEDDSWPEDDHWWDQYTPEELRWLLTCIPEVKRYHYDKELESILRKRSV